MTGVFEFNAFEIMTFFAVLVRLSVVMVILPIFGDNAIPSPVKILLPLAVTIAVFPVLVADQIVVPQDAEKWSATAGSLISTIGMEAVFGAALGLFVRMLFSAFQITGELMGTFMGFSAASQYDPQQESSSQLVARLLTTLTLLLFITIDGHHQMLKAVIRSYEMVGLGHVTIGGAFVEKLMHFSGEMIRLGLQLSAPMAISLFVVNVIYGVFSKALPQMNILVLSLSISALVGFIVLLTGLPEFYGATSEALGRIGEEMGSVMRTMKGP